MVEIPPNVYYFSMLILDLACIKEIIHLIVYPFIFEDLNLPATHSINITMF